MSLFTKQVTWVQIPVATYQMLMWPESGEGGGLQNRCVYSTIVGSNPIISSISHWCNGSMAGSNPVGGGSNPSWGAKVNKSYWCSWKHGSLPNWCRGSEPRIGLYKQTIISVLVLMAARKFVALVVWVQISDMEYISVCQWLDEQTLNLWIWVRIPAGVRTN